MIIIGTVENKAEASDLVFIAKVATVGNRARELARQVKK